MVGITNEFLLFWHLSLVLLLLIYTWTLKTVRKWDTYERNDCLSCHYPWLPDSDRDRPTGPEQVVVAVAFVVVVAAAVVAAVVAEEQTWTVTWRFQIFHVGPLTMSGVVQWFLWRNTATWQIVIDTDWRTSIEKPRKSNLQVVEPSVEIHRGLDQEAAFFGQR